MEQILHGCGRKTVALKGCRLVYDIHIQSQPAQGPVGLIHTFLVMKPLIPRPLCVFHCPEIIPVVEDGRPGSRSAARKLPELSQHASHAADLLKGSGIAAAIVIDHRPVKFLRGSPALPHLKVQHALRAMGNALERRRLQHSRLLQLAHTLPVGG